MSEVALEGLSEALAGEVAPSGIRATLVEPGPVNADGAPLLAQIADLDVVEALATVPPADQSARPPASST